MVDAELSIRTDAENNAVLPKLRSKDGGARMIAIKLVDARRGLNIKCRELFNDEKIAESIYRYLCDGIEECDDVEPERKHGKWIWDDEGYHCSECFFHAYGNTLECLDGTYQYCPNCGADMRERKADADNG